MTSGCCIPSVTAPRQIIFPQIMVPPEQMVSDKLLDAIRACDGLIYLERGRRLNHSGWRLSATMRCDKASLSLRSILLSFDKRVEFLERAALYEMKALRC